MVRACIGTLLCFSVAFLGGCGKTNLDEFKEFVSEPGKFKVLMPGTPKEQMQNAAGVAFKMYTAEVRDGGVIVGFGDMPIPKGESATDLQKRLDGARDGMVANTKSTLTGSSNIMLGNYPGREVLADLPNNQGKLRARVYIVDGRMYQVMMIGKANWSGWSKQDQFFNSFALTGK